MTTIQRIFGWILVLTVVALAIFGAYCGFNAIVDKRVNDRLGITPAPKPQNTPVVTTGESVVETEVSETPVATAVSETPVATVVPDPVATATPVPVPTELPKQVEVEELNLTGRTTKDTALYKGPSTLYEAVEAVPAGTELNIVGQAYDWYCIRNENGNFYFVEKSMVETSSIGAIATTTPGGSKTTASNEAPSRMERAIVSHDCPIYNDGKMMNQIGVIPVGSIVYTLEKSGNVFAIRFNYEGHQVVGYCEAANLVRAE